MQEAYDYRNQDVIIDEISDNLNRLAYFLNEYSFNGSIDVNQLNTVENTIDDNITTLIGYHSSEMPLFTQMQNSFLQLKPLLLLMTTSSNALNGTAIWNSVFNLIDSMQSSTSNFSKTINGQLGQAASNIQYLLISLIVSMIAFFSILYWQIFGHTLKETEQFEKNAYSLQLTNEALENLAIQRSKQLKDAERMATIGQTAGMVGHDIRNPLQAIVGDVYLLRAEFEAKPECNTITAQESFTSIETNIAYINKIVADLQDYARPLKP
jgi:signal transduction histidine kinase